MLVTTLALLHGQVVDAEDVMPQVMGTTSPVPTAARGLLITLVSVEDSAFQLTHVALAAYVLSLDEAGRPTGVDLLHPLTELTSTEQVALRAALVRQSWSAWARAPQHVRALLGRAEPPLMLAEAARQLAIPLATLANATLNDRLPTIRAGDRHLVYLETIIEAQEHGLLHVQRGRPRRRAH